MPYSRYAQACRNQIAELVQSLNQEKADQLYKYLTGHADEFRLWRRQNYSEVLDFVRATPAARRKKKSWQEPLQKLLLTYTAILHIEYAEILLSELANTPLEPGWPYRDMAVHAGEAYCSIVFQKEPDEWPFSE